MVQESIEIKDKNNKDENIIEKNDNKQKEEEKDIENISPLNITNEKILNESKSQLHNFLYENKEGKDILELPEEQDGDLKEEEEEKEKEKENSKKNFANISKFKSVPNLCEDKQQSKSSLLNRKRTTNSDLSDVSFNSISNENDYVNNNNNGNNSKRSKNNLAKENILKIFCDNSSVK